MTGDGLAMILASLYQSMARAAGLDWWRPQGGRKALSSDRRPSAVLLRDYRSGARRCLTQANGETRNGADPVW